MTIRALATDRRAVISVELALVSSLLLVPLTLGAVDAAELLVVRSQLDRALHQALFLAYASNGTAAVADIQTTAAQAFGAGATPTVTATITPYCIAAATGFPLTGTPLAPVNGVCTGLSLQSYLSVTVTVTVTLTFAVPWVAQTSTLSVSGRARVL